MAGDNHWMADMAGRHQVDLGASLVRALKARAGEPKPGRSKIPVNVFHSFRYKFKPESIDDDRPGQVEPKPNADGLFRVSRPSAQGENLLFTGTERPAREWECVLILNEETGLFTLEKLDSSLDLAYDGRSVGHAAGLSSSEVNKEDPDPNGSSLEDAEGVSDLDAMDVAAQIEEVLEKDEMPPPSSRKVANPAMSKIDSTPSSLQKKIRTQSTDVKSKSKNKPKPAGKAAAKTKQKKSDPDNIEVAALAFPQRTSARNKPPDKASSSHDKMAIPLALPTASVPPRPSDVLVPPQATTVAFTSRYEGSSDGSIPTDEDDADMEAVPHAIPAEEDAEHEIDADEFALELAETLMTDEENGDMDIFGDKPKGGGPVSLNQYAGGQDNGQDEDEFSSSDESDY